MKAEKELLSGKTLKALKQRLKPVPDVSGLSKEDKQKIIIDATSIAGHTPEKTFCDLVLRGRTKAQILRQLRELIEAT